MRVLLCQLFLLHYRQVIVPLAQEADPVPFPPYVVPSQQTNSILLNKAPLLYQLLEQLPTCVMKNPYVKIL